MDNFAVGLQDVLFWRLYRAQSWSDMSLVTVWFSCRPVEKTIFITTKLVYYLRSIRITFISLRMVAVNSLVALSPVH